MCTGNIHTFQKVYLICIVHVHGFKNDIDNMTVRLKKCQNPINVGDEKCLFSWRNIQIIANEITL